MHTEIPIHIGISSCLLGERVRYDGGHKLNTFIKETLGRFFEFVPVCPEMGIGMGVPREPVRLTGDLQRPRALGEHDKTFDVTEVLERYSEQMVAQLTDISGYILKRGSPSCGMQGVKIYSAQDQIMGGGSGIYARTLMERFPSLLVAEEHQVTETDLCEIFLEQVFIYKRWQRLIAGEFNKAGLMDFHVAHKFNVLAHDEMGYVRPDQLVTRLENETLQVVAKQYIACIMEILCLPTTQERHVDLLKRVAGYLRPYLGKADIIELQESIDAYGQGHSSLIAPIVLIKRYLQQCPGSSYTVQHYLNPQPNEIALRSSL